MVKINNKRKLKYYLKDYDSGNISQKLAVKYLGITPRRFRQLYEIFKLTGYVPAIGLNLGRAETPNEAFINKMPPEVWLGFAFKMFGW